MAILLAMTNPSPLKLLVEDRLGEPVEEFVKARRPLRVPSWRDIAKEMSEKTGLTINHQTLLNWANGVADTETTDEQTASAS